MMFHWLNKASSRPTTAAIYFITAARASLSDSPPPVLLYCTITILCYTILHYTTLYYTILHHIIRH